MRGGTMKVLKLAALALIWICWASAADAKTPNEKPESKPSTKFHTKELSLPNATGLVTLDYVAYDAAHQRLWVPAGNLGAVEVIDERTDHITPVTGFHTGEYELRGRKRVLGPSSATVGDGVIYVGNRADSSICPINMASLKVGDCLRIATPAEGLAGAPDGVVYVAITKEVWVTRAAPPLGIGAADRAVTIFDAADPSHLKPKGKIALSGSAEGYAVDS